MERHWEHDLEELKQRLLWMGSLAERAVHQAVHAVLDAEEPLAEAVLNEEDAINEIQIEIDERVQRLLALQAPMAADLRFLYSAPDSPPHNILHKHSLPKKSLPFLMPLALSFRLLLPIINSLIS